MCIGEIMVVLSRNLGYRLSVICLGPWVSLQLFLGSSTSFRYFAFLYSRIKFSCAYILDSFYSFVYWWTSRLILFSCWYKQWLKKHRCTSTSVIRHRALWLCIRSGIAGSHGHSVFSVWRIFHPDFHNAV